MPEVRQDLVKFVFLAVVIQIPFELRQIVFGLSNLQWTFVLLVLLTSPDLLANWKDLLSDRLARAAAIFIGVEWLAAIYAPEFHTNAVKAATRLTAGLLLIVISKRLSDTTSGYVSKHVLTTWIIVSAGAAAYALSDYAGFGFPWLFRTEEFYIGQTLRLSGSFEYPNTAAAYFAMSLPIVWWSSFRTILRTVFVFALWCAVILTFSKGALLALPAVALIARRRAAVPMLATGLVAYAALVPLAPYLIDRFYGPVARNPIGVEYNAEWNYLQQSPHATEILPLEIHNIGISTLRSRGQRRSAVAYRWWNVQTEKFFDASPLVTALPADVRPGETVRVDAAFQTPDEPGEYLLVFELFTRNFDWFSRMTIVPFLVQADIHPHASRTTGWTDLSSIYKRGQDATTLSAAVPRSSLWKAALKMFIDHPFGVGPDNYRLQYGNYFGVKRWDTHVHSNNLYLEILTGGGILGLAAFGFMIAQRRWGDDPTSLGAAVFLVHGFVDVFLMTTPIYFAFWILMAL